MNKTWILFCLTLTKNVFNSEVEKTILDRYIHFINIIGKVQLNDEAKTSISNTFNYFIHLIKEDDGSDEIQQVLRNVLGDFIPAVIRGEVTTDEVLRYMYNNIHPSIILHTSPAHCTFSYDA